MDCCLCIATVTTILVHIQRHLYSFGKIHSAEHLILSPPLVAAVAVVAAAVVAAAVVAVVVAMLVAVVAVHQEHLR